MDALFVGFPFLMCYSVLTTLVTVVRGKEDVGVVQDSVAVELVHHPLHQVV